MKLNKGRIYLIPTYLGHPDQKYLSGEIIEVCSKLNYFLVENLRTARRFISGLNLNRTIQDLHFQVLDKDTDFDQLSDLMTPVLQGNDLGIMSEAGCPGIADPGAIAVYFAHRHEIEVVPLTGPSSIIHALMASGLDGQQFSFHGYLPVKNPELSKKIRQLEKDSARLGFTQIFIETPYRNQKLWQALMENCLPETMICLAVDLQGARHFIKTKPVKEWKDVVIDIHKAPAVFLLSSLSKD
jgi:16S rRNA (cytidine1402-2'-O)-methyltransferase